MYKIHNSNGTILNPPITKQCLVTDVFAHDPHDILCIIIKFTLPNYYFAKLNDVPCHAIKIDH
jgi:hypothetical protein